MPALNLCDLIELADIKLGEFKIHLATGTGDINPPLLAYFQGRFQGWQEYQTRRNFPCEAVLALIKLPSDKWLFVGLWDVLGVTEKSNSAGSWFEYSTSERAGLEHLSGRVIVSFKRDFRASYLQGNRFRDQLVVSQILSERMSIGDFPGHSSTLIRHGELVHVVNRGIESWRSALRNVAGVYLITDTSCGKHYVGSAYGKEGIWGRWCAYAATGHGNNLELQELLRKQGSGHVQNFQYSVLEICDVLSTKEEVLEREVHWKKALGSREFGYNSN